MSNKKSPVAKTKVNKTKDGQATKQAQAANKLKIKTKLDNKFLNEYLMKHEGKEKVVKSIPKVKELYNMYDDIPTSSDFLNILKDECKKKYTEESLIKSQVALAQAMQKLEIEKITARNTFKVENTKETPPLALEQKKVLENTSRYSLTENGWIKEYPMRYTGGNNFFSSIINWFKNLFK